MASQLLSKTSLLKKDRACVWHPFTQGKIGASPLLIERGKGAYLYDRHGTGYLDAISSWWVNLHGHAHPYIAQRVKRQIDTLEHVIFAGCTHQPAIELAARLLSILPGAMNKVFYSDNGSTAVEVALKMALQFWRNQDPMTKRTQIISFRGGYHGDTFGAMSVAGKSTFNRPFWDYLFDVEQIDPPFEGKEEESLRQFESIACAGKAACFIFEPLVLGANGMRIYSAAGLNALLALCKKHRILAIADEVMTGFGRMGTLFSCDQLENFPDMICLSKGITGGFLPLAVTACTEEMYHAFLSDDPCKAFLHGHSYTANPLACSSGLASLDLLESEASRQQREMIATAHRQFCLEYRSFPQLKRCESIGTLLVLEYRSGNDSYFNPLKQTLAHFFLERNILLRPLGNVLYVLPPYCVSKGELEMIYENIVDSLEMGR